MSQRHVFIALVSVLAIAVSTYLVVGLALELGARERCREMGNVTAAEIARCVNIQFYRGPRGKLSEKPSLKIHSFEADQFW